jgi:acyl carrier protein
MFEETTENCVERLVLEYAQSVPPIRPLDERLSLKNDLAMESLALVSLALRLGGEFGVDVVDLGLELGELKTLGDLIKIARTLKTKSTQGEEERVHETRRQAQGITDREAEGRKV